MNNANQIVQQIVATRAEMSTLLQKRGHLPARNTKNGKKWMELEFKLDQLKQDRLTASKQSA